MTNLKYDELIDKYANMVYKIALNYTKSVFDEEDISQNVFLKVYDKSPDFKDEEYEKKWIIRVTINECHNLWKSFWNRHTIGFDEIKISDEVINRIRAREKKNKNEQWKRTILIAASLVLMFITSNIISYAATGKIWINTIFERKIENDKEEKIEQLEEQVSNIHKEIENLKNEKEELQSQTQYETEKSIEETSSNSSDSVDIEKDEKIKNLNQQIEKIQNELEKH